MVTYTCETTKGWKFLRKTKGLFTISCVEFNLKGPVEGDQFCFRRQKR